MLVESTVGSSDRRSVAFPGGAGLLGADGLWVLTSAEPARALGPALAVARSQGSDGQPVPRLHLVVDPEAGADPEVGGGLARRAGQFSDSPDVWVVEGRSLLAVAPSDLPAPSTLSPDVAAFASQLVAAGADPMVEHGRLIGEVLGLEVARVVVADDGAGPRLEVGIGRFDREGHAMVSAGIDPVETLTRIVDFVRAERGGGDGSHPLARLAAAHGLRSRLVAEPALAGPALAGASLVPLAPVDEAPDLRTPWPAPAFGLDREGRPVVAVCSVGVDLDLVPAAADARLAADRLVGAHHRLVLVVPARDALPVTADLAAALASPAELVALEGRS